MNKTLRLIGVVILAAILSYFTTNVVHNFLESINIILPCYAFSFLSIRSHLTAPCTSQLEEDLVNFSILGLIFILWFIVLNRKWRITTNVKR